MKTKLSVREAVTKVIKENGALTPIEIIKKIARPKAQIYTAISKLKSYGYITRLTDGRYAIADAPALTAMTPDIEPLVKKVQAMNTESRLAAARAEVDNLQHKLQEMTIKYYDTLAVLKYLESKLIITKK